ncbi:MAG TPA: PQQ-binding-like beta-propeller repeat protein, partial [Steroidobacteraceae bacterium]|nr:PQQ-binding-like beta-propeller repeat protein [Steroidobacteraceae bacterium]
MSHQTQHNVSARARAGGRRPQMPRNKMRRISAPLVALAVLSTPLLASATPPEATTFRMTVDHAAVTTSGGALALQQQPLWTVALSGRISYPLIADGMVFVTTADTHTYGAGTHLYAFDAAT